MRRFKSEFFSVTIPSQNSAEPTEDMSLLVWLVRQLSKYAPFRGRRDPERINAATKQLEDALEEKCTSRILVNELVRDRRVRIFKKGHKSTIKFYNEQAI